MEQSGAEHKFLNIPELISRLVSMLDPVSTLVQSQAVNKETLQKSLSSRAWNTIIRRSSQDAQGLLKKEDVLDLICESDHHRGQKQCRGNYYSHESPENLLGKLDSY